MSFLLVLWAAVLLDLLFGDPRWFPHPVRLIGLLAGVLERLTRSLPFSEKNSGRLTVFLLLLSVALFCGALFALFAVVSQVVFLTAAAFVLSTTIAARDLVAHARRVHEALGRDLNEARRSVAMMVGRDTDLLDEAGIIRACVESVAENMSDGIIAPLFWAGVGAIVGLPAGGYWPIAWSVALAMLYKGVNTMDSMFGYKNERYLQFGSCPARLDDVVNYLPARLSGLALVVAAPLCGADLKTSGTILLRDHARHSSPNAGWPEAAMAGALGIQLGGESTYFGRQISKPFLGDALSKPVSEHILKANHLVLAASLLCLLTLTALYLLLIPFWG